MQALELDGRSRSSLFLLWLATTGLIHEIGQSAISYFPKPLAPESTAHGTTESSVSVTPYK